jgi:hypothetical protein
MQFKGEKEGPDIKMPTWRVMRRITLLTVESETARLEKIRRKRRPSRGVLL